MMKSKTHDENMFNTPEKGCSMNRLRSGYQSARLHNSFRSFRVAVILVPAKETRDQAWGRHVKNNPEDRNADIKIFNFARQ
jgi:hypothetical protein